MSFDQTLAFGQVGESHIAQWLRNKSGWTVLPVYEKEIDNGKGPRLFLPSSKTLVAPDMLVFRDSKVAWVEAKHKSVFSWHRRTRRWVTGIDKRHYDHYLEVQRTSDWTVWLMFLHRSSEPWDGDKRHGCPAECPTGLYTCRIDEPPNHTAPPLRSGNGHGASGMVYWAHHQLYELATLEDMNIEQDLVAELPY